MAARGWCGRGAVRSGPLSPEQRAAACGVVRFRGLPNKDEAKMSKREAQLKERREVDECMNRIKEVVADKKEVRGASERPLGGDR